MNLFSVRLGRVRNKWKGDVTSKEGNYALAARK